MNIRAEALLLLGILTACVAAPGEPFAAPDPTVREVQLPSGSDWNASLVMDIAPTGVWTVAVLQAFSQYASPEIVGLDDLGRCHVLVSYSGKWTPVTTIADKTWLGGLAQADVDPRVPGWELYTGGKSGNLYQVIPHREGVVDNRRVAHLPGREVHTLVAGDLDEARAGQELIAFTRPGGLFLLTPRDAADGFDVEQLEELSGRVRNAVLVPAGPGEPATVATVERSGRLRLLSWTPAGHRWRTIFERPMGMGRIAFATVAGRRVLYNTCDDGTVWRHEEAAPGGDWSHELVYAGPQGPRGLAAGRFDADPGVETLVVFGYSARVELLKRVQGNWTRETLFEDRDKGHWLAAGELDGRNGTDEIVLSGYGGRIVLLARPPGYGLGDVLTAPLDP